MKHPLTGTWVALYTPFTADGAVDWPAYRSLCERVAAANVGLVPCGTTGETPTLTQAEYDRVVTIAVEVAGGAIPVIAGTGANGTAKTIAANEHVKSLGADAALVVTPYYNKPSQLGIVRHFQAVADASPVPVVLYNVPGRTGRNMSVETTLELAPHDNIVAIKEASGDIAQMTALINGAPAGFSVLSGDDALTLPLVLAGGQGIVSVAGNIAPAETKALVDAALAGDLAEARKLQARYQPLFSALFGAPNPIPVKRAGVLLGHHKSYEARLPMTADSLTPPLLEALVRSMTHAGLL